MTRLRRGAEAALAAVALVGIPARSAEPLPFDVSLEVDYGTPRGRESLRDSLEQALRSELGSCFRSVGTGADPAAYDLVVRVVIEDLLEETEFEMSIAERSSAPQDVGRSQVARVAALTTAMILTVDGRRPVRFKRFRSEQEHRPLLGEDAREWAANEFVGDVVRRVRRFVCKGSPAEWRKELEPIGPAATPH